MTLSKKTFLAWWLSGLAIFALSIFLHSPLAIAGVSEGILDHQGAGSAARVEQIQQLWADAGLLTTARLAMQSDLIFIGVYGIGAVLAGAYYRASDARLLRVTGWVLALSGVVFLASDYLETLLQLVQLNRFEGDDRLAAIAAACGPYKVASFLVSFALVLIALAAERFSSRAA